MSRRSIFCITLLVLHGVGGASLTSSTQESKQRTIYSSASHNLPPVSSWDHNPVFLQAKSSVVSVGLDRDEGNTCEGMEGECDQKQMDPSCPIGIPFNFESDLFKGKALVRVKGLANSRDPTSDEKYFQNRKRRNQIVIQGKFKEPISYTDIVIGSEYKDAFSTQPPVLVQKLLGKMLRRVSPSTELKLVGDKPKALVCIGEKSQVISVDEEGDEPDIHSVMSLKEKGFSDTYIERKNFFSSLHQRFKNGDRAEDTTPLSSTMSSSSATNDPMTFDTTKVYTFESYDNEMDYSTYTMHLASFIKLDMVKKQDRQPFQIMSRKKSDGRYLWLFTIYHSKHSTE